MDNDNLSLHITVITNHAYILAIAYLQSLFISTSMQMLFIIRIIFFLNKA